MLVLGPLLQLSSASSLLLPLPSLLLLVLQQSSSLPLLLNEPQRRLWFIFGTHLAGLPLPGSPLWFSLPKSSVERTSLWRGEGLVKG